MKQRKKNKRKKKPSNLSYVPDNMDNMSQRSDSVTKESILHGGVTHKREEVEADCKFSSCLWPQDPRGPIWKGEINALKVLCNPHALSLL